MTAAEIDAAVATLESDPDQEWPWARDVAEMLTAGEGVEMLSQAAIQQFCWYQIPKRLPMETWDEVCRTVEALMDALGRERWAAVAGSDITAGVLDAFRSDAADGTIGAAGSSGLQAARAAEERSGVGLPDGCVLAWGEMFQFAEQHARDAVERALEAAIETGELVPGGRGWRQRSVEIANAALTTATTELAGQSHLSLVWAERAAQWTRCRGAAAQARSSVVDSIVAEPAAPDDVEAVIGPVGWLLGLCDGDGAGLTASHYLDRALVVEGVGRFPQWWPDWHDKPPRSESDVFQLSKVRDYLQRRNWVRRKGRTLRLTPLGRQLVADPQAVLVHMADDVVGSGPWFETVAEQCAIVQLAGPAGADDLIRAIAEPVADLGWSIQGAPVDPATLRESVWLWRRWCRALGWTEPTPTPPGTPRHQDQLTDTGRAALTWFLHRRATAPAKRPW